VELLEYAFGLNPSQPDTGSQPRVVVEGGYLTISIEKKAGVTFAVQSAGGLNPSSWSAATTHGARRQRDDLEGPR